jgi:oxalate decarboxylase
MDIVSRRNLLAVTAGGSLVAAAAKAAHAQSFGNPDLPPQGAINAKGNPASVSDPGPQNPALASQFPSPQSPPATDVGSMPLPWASFNNAAKRIQNGGWARQVTQADFAVSEEISGVNMRLTAGGIRELHWHLASEWAYMTYGNCRITVLDELGRTYVSDVKEGDIWFFPAGLPHSLQGLGPDGCEFVICFDDGKASEFNTLLVTDWLAHTPPKVLAKNFGLSVDTFSKIPLQDLYIFQGKLPGSLAADRAAVSGPQGSPPYPFTFSMGSMKPTRQTKGGEVRVVDSSTFTVAKTIAAALVTVHPGGMREMHWHPNADEWQYWIKGKGRMTVFNTGPNALTMDFNPGDIGYVKRNYGHYLENVGDTDVMVLEVFRSSYFADVSLSDWLARTPPALVAQHLNVDSATIAKFPNDKPEVMPQ